MQQKRITLIVLAGLILGSLTGLAIHHYQNYQQYKNHAQVYAQTKADDQARKDRVAELSHQQAIVAGYNTAVTECEKGKAAYALLTPVQTKTAKLSAPSCPAELVQ